MAKIPKKTTPEKGDEIKETPQAPQPQTGVGTPQPVAPVYYGYPNTSPIVCRTQAPHTAVAYCGYPHTTPVICVVTAVHQAAVAQTYPNTSPIICATTMPTAHGTHTYPNTSPVICGTTVYYAYAQQYYRAQVLAHAQAQTIATTMPFCPSVLCQQPINQGLVDTCGEGANVPVKPVVTQKEDIVTVPKKKESTAKKTTVPKKTTAPKKVKKTTPTKASATDDLKVIEGIGPKIEQLLNKAGISTWSELGAARIGVLRGILADAGRRYAIHDPKTWARQAKLAAAGNWDKLKAWQDELKGGK